MIDPEIPQIASFSSSSLCYAPDNLCGIGMAQQAYGAIAGPLHNFQKLQNQLERRPVTLDRVQEKKELKKEKVEMAKSGKRIVQVFIVDTDDNLKGEGAILYQGGQKFTDLTDQELFFELDMKKLLQQHNTDRAKVINKKESTPDKPVYLEPIRIRDLKMVVSTLAEF